MNTKTRNKYNQKDLRYLTEILSFYTKPYCNHSHMWYNRINI